MNIIKNLHDVYFTSDSHFGHENIITFCKRPFASVKEMNEALLTYWNETVAPEDTVYHLGDVAMGSFSDSWSYVSRLHGEIHLVLGNHDRIAEKYGMKEKYVTKHLPQYMGRFMTVQYEMLFEGYKLHHFPYEGDHTKEERFKELRPVNNGRPIIHGHVHDEWQLRGLQLNVGVDVWNFRPVHRDTVISMAQVLDPIYGQFNKS